MKVNKYIIFLNIWFATFLSFNIFADTGYTHNHPHAAPSAYKSNNANSNSGIDLTVSDNDSYQSVKKYMDSLRPKLELVKTNNYPELLWYLDIIAGVDFTEIFFPADIILSDVSHFDQKIVFMGGVNGGFISHSVPDWGLYLGIESGVRLMTPDGVTLRVGTGKTQTIQFTLHTAMIPMYGTLNWMSVDHKFIATIKIGPSILLDRYTYTGGTASYIPPLTSDFSMILNVAGEGKFRVTKGLFIVAGFEASPVTLITQGKAVGTLGTGTGAASIIRGFWDVYMGAGWMF